jgi:hypothetical protein
MKINYIETECRDKVSPHCTKVFRREVKRGRPQVNCEACKNFKAPTGRFAAKPASKVTTELTKAVSGELGKGQCPCGNVFDINPGRGRKPSKCHDCRTAGIVYRTDEDGRIQEIRAEALAEEQREIREANGRDRAENLFQRMQPLIQKRNREVIVH